MIHPKLISWIESFLSDRMLGVVLNDQNSLLALNLIISGVPQGAVLGPVLFLIFINDINLCISDSIIRLFADDTRVSKPISCEKDVVTLWSDNNNIALHTDKFEDMSYQHNRVNLLLPFVCEQFQYSVSDKFLLRPVPQLKDLGVTMSSDLSWIPYIYEITCKARQKAAWVLSVFYFRSEAIMLTLYKSMVHSLLEYCCPLWSPESVQNVFTSKISGMPELIY